MGENQPVLLTLSTPPTAAYRIWLTAMSFYTVDGSTFRVRDQFVLLLVVLEEMGPKIEGYRRVVWSASTGPPLSPAVTTIMCKYSKATMPL